MKGELYYSIQVYADPQTEQHRFTVRRDGDRCPHSLMTWKWIYARQTPFCWHKSKADCILKFNEWAMIRIKKGMNSLASSFYLEEGHHKQREELITNIEYYIGLIKKFSKL